MRSSKRKAFILAAASSFVGLYGMSVNRASAANGTPNYLDVNGTTANFGSPTGTYAMSTLNWTTDTTGVAAPVALPTNAQLTVGNNASDFSGANFSINIDLGNGVRGIVVNSNNANVTLVGTANANFNTGGITCTVAAGSTLTWNVTRSTGGNVGFNMSNRDVTFNGGGVNTFITHFMANDNNQVAANFNAAGNWAAGDFNYDGIVNALDFNAVATNFGKVALPSQPLGAPVLGTLVPEPGTALLGVAAGLGLMRRRRRAR